LLEKDSKILTAEDLGLEAERAACCTPGAKAAWAFSRDRSYRQRQDHHALLDSAQYLYAEKKILTIEDPVEYELPGVAQIPVRPSRNFSFATGLRSICARIRTL